MAGEGQIDKLDPIGFDTLLRQQDPFGQPDSHFDLRSVQFVSPCGLTLLASACYSLHARGRRPIIHLAGRSVPSYLVRASFEPLVRPIVRFDPPFRKQVLGTFDQVRGRNPILIELTRLCAGSDLPELLDRFVAVLRGRLSYPKAAAYDVAVAVSEAGQNVFEHNTATCGFVAMQAYTGRQGVFLEIGISDCGDGLLASLRRNARTPSLVSDHDAIAHATQLGTSEFDDLTRGRGLYHLLEIAYKYAGSIQIRSGAAVVRYRTDRKQGWTFDVPPMPGVHLALSLPAQGSPC